METTTPEASALDEINLPTMATATPAHRALDEEYRIEMVKCQNKLADFRAAFDIFQDKNAERIPSSSRVRHVSTEEETRIKTELDL